MYKPKRILITPAKAREMKVLANLTGIPEQLITDIHVQSLTTGGKVHDLLLIAKAWIEAERDGRDYTPIFWHRTDDGVLHITMWDMDKSPRGWGYADT